MSPIKAQRKPSTLTLYPVSALSSAIALPEVFAKAQAKDGFKILGSGGVSVRTSLGVVSGGPNDYILVRNGFDGDFRGFVRKVEVFEIITAADFAANYEVLPE